MGICNNCHNFKVHGKNCWFYWEEKKECSQFQHKPDEEPKMVNDN